jgi:hypothetical protein
MRLTCHVSDVTFVVSYAGFAYFKPFPSAAQLAIRTLVAQSITRHWSPISLPALHDVAEFGSYLDVARM